MKHAALIVTMLALAFGLAGCHKAEKMPPVQLAPETAVTEPFIGIEPGMRPEYPSIPGWETIAISDGGNMVILGHQSVKALIKFEFSDRRLADPEAKIATYHHVAAGISEYIADIAADGDTGGYSFYFIVEYEDGQCELGTVTSRMMPGSKGTVITMVGTWPLLGQENAGVLKDFQNFYENTKAVPANETF